MLEELVGLNIERKCYISEPIRKQWQGWVADHKSQLLNHFAPWLFSHHCFITFWNAAGGVALYPTALEVGPWTLGQDLPKGPWVDLKNHDSTCCSIVAWKSKALLDSFTLMTFKLSPVALGFHSNRRMRSRMREIMAADPGSDLLHPLLGMR